MSSSQFSSTSATQRRTAQTGNNPTSSVPILFPDIDPAPNPRPISQFLAIGFVISLALLQFLPATHFRDPSDPLRKWVPFDSIPSSSFGNSGASHHGNSGFITTHGRDDGMVHVVSWMDCVDLRVLAVLANSTLSSSRYPDLVYFHFFIPEGLEFKVSYYKLKVLFPHSNLEILGQKEVREKISTVNSGGKYAGIYFEELVPFVIPSVHQSLNKFIYVSPNVIVKGRVEELIGVDLSNFAIAATEDCSKRLNSYIKSDVLDAIQRSASKPWVSGTPYVKHSCMPNLNVLLIDARKLEKDLVEAILWWSKVLNLSGRSSLTNPAVALALHDKYLKLSTSWLARDSTSAEINEGMIIHYDGPKSGCSEFGGDATPQSNHGNLWIQFLPPLSDRILGN
ncbi:hypothetical protein L1049_010337 [Liquidambar formosana]|uniref:Hexosyltransferase n=1 Tax=Liquidambar formosana TaxID=63359 RepID=A0AAP0R485_LIQFO